MFGALLVFLASMRLFRGRVFRSALYAGALAFLAHVALRFIPPDLFATSIVQTAVAYLAIGAGVLFIVTHHRRDGRALSQSQEEMFLIGAFGLFWFSLLIALRAYRMRVSPGSGSSIIDAVTGVIPARERHHHGQQGHGRHRVIGGEHDYVGPGIHSMGESGFMGCLPGEVCIEEEWAY